MQRLIGQRSARRPLRGHRGVSIKAQPHTDQQPCSSWGPAGSSGRTLRGTSRDKWVGCTWAPDCRHSDWTKKSQTTKPQWEKWKLQQRNEWPHDGFGLVWPETTSVNSTRPDDAAAATAALGYVLYRLRV